MEKSRITVMGRDAREWYAAVELAGEGYDVTYRGPVPARGVRTLIPPTVYRDAADAARDRRVLVGPVRGWHAEDTDALTAAIAALAPEALVIMGSPPPLVREQAAAGGHRLVDLLQRDDFALLNAVPTAEGAICEAVAAGAVTLGGSRVLVTGYGRTARVLAQRLKALEAAVCVVARSAGQRAAARAAGLDAVDFDHLPVRAGSADFIFNTVPVPVLTAGVLGCCPVGTVIIDIASEPGGVDREAVEALALPFRWPLGIPGRVAPRSAGRILHQVVHTVMAEEGLAAPARRRVVGHRSLKEVGAS